MSTSRERIARWLPGPASLGAIRVAAWLAPLHLALPAGLSWVGRRHGVEAAELVVAAIHALFPLLYLLVAERVRFGFGQWALLLALNHGALLVGWAALG
jgi:hypothetical protein